MNQTGAKVLLGMRNTDVRTGDRIDVCVMGALYIPEFPSGVFEFSDQLAAVHGVYYTH